LIKISTRLFLIAAYDKNLQVKARRQNPARKTTTARSAGGLTLKE